MTNDEQTDKVKRHDFAGTFLGILPASNILIVCAFISSLSKEGSPYLGITGVQFFQIKLKPVRRVSADAYLKIFQQKVLYARRKPTLRFGEFEVAQPKAMDIVSNVAFLDSFPGQY